MEENKYYVPEIEEFCVGFEYEALEKAPPYNPNIMYLMSPLEEDTWFKFKFPDPYVGWNVLKILKREVRVKKLDKEDILESPFILTGKPTDNKLYFRTEDNRYGITLRDSFYEDGLSNVHIYEFRGEGAGTIFCGKIKNKMEFKKLLRQLEI